MFWTVRYYEVTYEFQSESTVYSCLNVKGVLPLSRGKIGSLSDCSWTQTRYNLIRKQILNYLAKPGNLAKWLSVRLRTKWLWMQVQLQSSVFWLRKKGKISNLRIRKTAVKTCRFIIDRKRRQKALSEAYLGLLQHPRWSTL